MSWPMAGPRAAQTRLAWALAGVAAMWPVDRAGASPPAPAAAPQPRADLAWMLLQAEGLDPAALRQHLGLRLPDTELREPGEVQPPLSEGQLAGLADVRRAGEDVHLTLILTDGRAFDRRVVQPGEAPERVVASELASLVSSVVEGRVAPDRLEEADFLDADEGSNPSEPGPKPGPEPGREPGTEPGADAQRRSPGVWLGVRLSPVFTAGLAPGGELGRGLYGGGELGVDLAWRKGGSLSLAMSMHGRGDPLGVRRLRGGIGGGYRWRRGAFAWLTVGRVELEGWSIGSQETLFSRGIAVQRRPPLLGATLVTSPGWYRALGSRHALRIGPRMEFSMRGSLGDPNGAPRISDGTDPQAPVLARLGGFELSTGIELQFWFGLGSAED